MTRQKKIIEAFLAWYPNDPHALQEDYYHDTIKAEYLNGLSKEAFITFFYDFARDGGKIQSGGRRTVASFDQNITERYEEFRAKVLEPFNPNFDLDSWLTWADGFNFFGQGLATIYLNRVDKTRYAIVNEKVINALPHLGFEKPASTKLLKKYHQIKDAEELLLREYPALDNYFKVDSLMHFLIGTEEGKSLIAADSNINEYFDLGGFKAYAPMVRQPYDKQHPTTKWYKHTQTQLNHLVALLMDRLGQNLFINYTERPRTQLDGQGKFVFKDYVLVGLSTNDLFPGPKGDLFIKISFESLSNKPVFALEVDINNNNDSNPFKTRRKEIRKKTHSEIIVDEYFPKNWNDLLNLIENNVKTLISQFVQIAKGNQIEQSDSSSEKNNMKDLNIILYGPPGTGKTYSTKDLAIQVIENKSAEEIKNAYPNRDGLNQKFRDYQKDGQIGFVTFHQSFGYEDFIEGIKPLKPAEDKQMQYDVLPGIFRKICIDALFSLFAQENPEETEQLTDFSRQYRQFVDIIEARLENEGSVPLKTKSGGEIEVVGISQQENLIVKHKNGERTYTASLERLSKLAKAFPDLSKIQNINDAFDQVIGGSNASTNWAVLNAIRQIDLKPMPVHKTDRAILDWKGKYDLMKEFKLEKFDSNKPHEKFVLIIDEINRGNVAQIFGELITLLEDDKRMGMKNALSATLPYSGDSFSVPPNLYIIGTMNTADRSVEALDTALRRRFSFVHMKPDHNKLSETEDGINLKRMLEVINQRLEILIDSDHTIGHAWFWEVKNLNGLQSAFKNKILPLLQEFFYNDYEKIGLVLGECFVTVNKVKSGVFAKFNGGTGLGSEYSDRPIFTLNNPETLIVEDYISIYTPYSSNQ
jgi:5-methylcytosine-specific restriction endonuclease McrBC GTP-binding regulatory subunit McrB